MRMGRQEAKEWISKTCGKGWLKLVDDVYDKLPEGVEIIQAYQKWAGLHFDTTEHDEQFELYLLEIQRISRETCEKCGIKGFHYVIENWEYTRCREHSENGINLNNLSKNT